MKQNEPATGIPVGHAPYANAPHQGSVGEFSTGLCDCFSDCGLCCLTCCCPCITFGRIAEIVDKGSSSCACSGALYALISFTGFQWIYSFTYRSKLKAQYGIPEDGCRDCCIHFCCQLCALCQEYRELEHRGHNLTLGWPDNTERQNPGMAPAMPAGMTR